MTKKPKQKSELSVSIPKDFNGEINVMGVHLGKPIEPITEHFAIGDLNTLRDKINEIIARG